MGRRVRGCRAGQNRPSGMFRIEVTLEAVASARGEGKSKREAEQNAAAIVAIHVGRAAFAFRAGPGGRWPRRG